MPGDIKKVAGELGKLITPANLKSGNELVLVYDIDAKGKQLWTVQMADALPRVHVMMLHLL